MIAPQKQRGFTLIELMVVITFLAIIGGFMIAGFRDFASFQQYNQAVSDVSFLLNQTRLSARSADADSSHGVKFTTSSVVQYVGDVYSAASPLNETTTYTLVTFEPNLTGGVDEITFNKLTGLPSATGTIVVRGAQFSASTTIVITDSGVVQ